MCSTSPGGSGAPSWRVAGAVRVGQAQQGPREASSFVLRRVARAEGVAGATSGTASVVLGEQAGFELALAEAAQRADEAAVDGVAGLFIASGLAVQFEVDVDLAAQESDEAVHRVSSPLVPRAGSGLVVISVHSGDVRGAV